MTPALLRLSRSVHTPFVPSANLELVRSIYAAWERGDFSSAEWAHPDIEFVMADGPSPSASTGLSGMAAEFRNFAGPWEGYGVIADEYREVDENCVLVLVHWIGRGKTSGLSLAEVPNRGANAFYLTDATVTRLVAYWDRERALADLGLSPGGDAADPSG